MLHDICEAVDGPGPEWYRELELEQDYLMSTNGIPESRPYGYRGAGRSLSGDEARQRLSEAARTAPSALATSREARAATPAPAMVRGTVLPPEPGPAGPAAIKGAVRVAEFPDRTPYPFAQIASDGGVWRIDPAEFKAKPESIRSAAWTWAKKKGLTVKVVLSDGQAFVQFSGDDER